MSLEMQPKQRRDMQKWVPAITLKKIAKLPGIACYTVDEERRFLLYRRDRTRVAYGKIYFEA